ncbi:MAG: A/G-specific adenine glycosylase [Acetatifactor sp.]|nr:A/G-specific adenine glycosylase [Acetatifactor sp.]
MNYRHIVPAEFVERPNRFIAYVQVEGQRETVHVKNTGRCRELLVPGARVYLEKSDNPERSTAYDLVAVEKGERLINMDSQAPNRVVEEWLHTRALFPHLRVVRPETKYGNSRFDFYIETAKCDQSERETDDKAKEELERIFMEVKGVTLEEDGVVRFPDAPTERAVKHVEELIQAKKDGYRVFVCFVVQMEGARYVTPNVVTHEAFARVLLRAKEQGVEIVAYDCLVTPESLSIRNSLPVYLPGDLGAVPEPLLAWYDGHRRILPWREDPTPYHVWVSEIMLQQTRVEAVKPYFERFMKAFPDIESLANAEEESLLKLWEGLGYYNRVRNLQKAAVQIMEEYGGRMPSDYEELLRLKGIGSYTAGAISSIAYGERNPAVDGNVLRVIARLRADDSPISDARVKSAVEMEMRRILPTDRPGDFNQALMELGACVCIPNGAPHCDECPIAQFCMAHIMGRETDYPQKAAPKARGIEEKTILVIRDAERAAIRKRSVRGLLAGMYEFPSLNGFHTAEEVVQYLAENGLRTIRVTPLPDARHIFSHREWHMKGYMVRVDELEREVLGDKIKDWLYIEPSETEDRYPIPAAFEAYTKYLNIKLGQEKYK